MMAWWRTVQEVAMLWRGAILVALAAAAGTAACREATTPGPLVTVALSGTIGPSIATDTGGTPELNCSLELRATAMGNGQAQWQEAVLRLYAGKAGTAPYETLVVPDSVVRAAWGGTDIAIGDARQSAWPLSGPAPFTVSIEFRYEPAGGGPWRAATVAAACGPPPDSAPPPPTITGFAIRSSGLLQPGDTLPFEYTATSAGGLWQTTATLSGPCTVADTIKESLQDSVTHAVVFRLPAACQLGVPGALTVTARDAYLQTTQLSLPLPALVDTTPPTAQVMVFPPEGGSATFDLAGTWFVGDTVRLVFLGADNHSVASLIWEVLPAGLRDSVPVSGASVSPWLKITVPASWVGSTQLRFYARDASGNVSQPVVTAPNAMAFFPRAAVTAIVDTLGGGPVTDVAFDLKRGLLYVLHNGSIQVVSLSSHAVVSTIQLPIGTPSFDLTVSGDSLVVALSVTGSLGVLDLRTSPPQFSTIPIAGLDTADKALVQEVRVAANGKALVTTEGIAAAAARLFTIDLGTGVQQIRSDAGDSGMTEAGAIERSYDRSVVVLNAGANEFQRYSAATDAFGPGQTALVLDGHPWVDGNGANVAISSQLYDANLSFRFFVRILPMNVGVPAALSPDGQTDYLEVPWEGIVRSRTSDGSTIDRIVNPIDVGLVRVSPDGHTLVTAETDFNTRGRISFITLP